MSAPNTPASNDFVLEGWENMFAPYKGPGVRSRIDAIHAARKRLTCLARDMTRASNRPNGGGPLGFHIRAEEQVDVAQAIEAVLALAAAPASPEPLNKEQRNNAELLASICQKARHSSASPVERDEALRDAATMLRDFARSVVPATSPEPASNEAPGRGGVEAVEGSLNYRVSWPRPATPSDLVPLWKGEFRDFDDWVSFATTRLTGTTDERGVEVSAICVDAHGRRCSVGAHFMRARDEGAFPVRYFWECSK